MNLYSASLDGETVKLLLEDGANINKKYKYGFTALSGASHSGHIETVKMLLKAGANVDEKDCDGNTALMKASQNGHMETVKILLRAGAIVNEEDENGNTASTKASKYGHTEIVKLLSNPPERSLFNRCVFKAYLHQLKLGNIPTAVKAEFPF